MKKTKLFFGAAILLLACAGAFAAKVASVSGDVYQFNPAGSGSYSLYSSGIPVPCSTGDFGCQNPANSEQLYLYDTTNGYQPLIHD